jgi:integrase
MVVFSVLTGLRRGELLNLRWDDFDDRNSTIAVQSSEEYHVKGGKMRTISLHPQACQILNRLHKSADSIFCSAEGKPYSGGYVQKKLKKYLRAAGLPECFHWHSLRHTFGTWAANSGVPPHIIKETMGHSSIKVTEMYIGTDHLATRAEISKIVLPSLPTPS